MATRTRVRRFPAPETCKQWHAPGDWPRAGRSRAGGPDLASGGEDPRPYGGPVL